jgi:methyltransferase-like protein 6
LRNDDRFFKPRQFLFNAFPVIDLNSEITVLELGAGNGSNIFALLEMSKAHVIITDLVVSSLNVIMKNDAVLNKHTQRYSCFLLDIVTNEVKPFKSYSIELSSSVVDVVLSVFVLSAIPPNCHRQALRNMYDKVKPGGYLCFRDYGLFDTVQLRATEKQIISKKCILRGDGTFSYFFSTDELQELFQSVGFAVVELKYVTIKQVNRRREVEMKRVYVHAILQRK